MWYVDVGAAPWIIRYAEGRDGIRWRVRPEPVLQIDQDWGKNNLFYPTVVKSGGVYLMWYGSYWRHPSQKTALGFSSVMARSTDARSAVSEAASSVSEATSTKRTRMPREEKRLARRA